MTTIFDQTHFCISARVYVCIEKLATPCPRNGQGGDTHNRAGYYVSVHVVPTSERRVREAGTTQDERSGDGALAHRDPTKTPTP